MNDTTSLLPARLSLADFGRARPDVPLFQVVTEAYLARYKGKTLTSYAADLRVFFAWCFERELDPITVDRGHLELWLRWMERPDAVKATRNHAARPLAQNTICRRYVAVAGWFKYAHLDGHILKNPCLHVESPKPPTEKLGTWSTRVEISVMLASARALKKWPSEYAFMCLIALNALRISEALGIDVEDLSENEEGYTQARIMGKGHKPAWITFTPMTDRAVALAVAGRTEGPLLRGRALDRIDHGERMSHAGARDLITRHAVACGIEDHKRLTPHSFRRGAISCALDARVPMRDVAKFARHSNIQTTERYDRSGTSPAASATHVLTSFIAGAG